MNIARIRWSNLAITSWCLVFIAGFYKLYGWPILALDRIYHPLSSFFLCSKSHVWGTVNPPCLWEKNTIFPTIFAHNFAHYFCPPCLPVRKKNTPLPPLAQPPKTRGNAARFGPVPLRRRTPRIIESHDLFIFLLWNMGVVFLVHVHNVFLSSCWLRAVEGFHFKPESQLNRLCSGLGSLSKWANFRNNN